MFKRCCSLGVLSLVFLLGITSVSFAGSGNISLEDGVMVVRGYSKSSPGKLSDILAAAEREGWDVITYTSENDTYNLSTLLQIGDEKIETYFQIGTGGHEKEILIIEGEIRIKGKASLTIGVKEDKSFSPTVKLDAPKLKDQELLAKGTNATFNCYNSTIVGFHRIAYRQGAKGEFIDSQFDKEVEIDCGASSVELQGAKVEGIKLSTRTEDCVRVKNCEMNGKLPLYVEYGANVIVYDSKIKSGTIVSRNKSHLILEGCQLDSLSFQVEKNSTILIKPYCLVRVLDTNGNALSGIKVRMECKESGDKEELVTNARGECLFKAASKMIDNLGFQKVNEYSYRISLDGKVVRDGWSPEKNITLEYRKKNGNYMEKGLPYEGNKNIICNLLEYGDFEICTNKPTDKYPGIPDGWAHLNLAGHHIHFPDLWFGVDETTAYHGRKSLKIKFPGTYLCDTAGYDYHRITGYPPLIVPGETYTASIYLKSDREGFPLTFVFGPARKKLTVGTSWKRYIVTATMPDSYPRMVYDLMRIHIYPGKDKRIIGGTLWLDAVQVEQGEIVHSYQPSLHESIVKKVVMPLKDINRRKIPVLAAIKTKSPPQIDGYLDDTCWKESAYVEDFILVDGSGYPAEQTKGYITYDDNYLYIGIECFDLHMDKLKTEEKQHDGNVWTDDCVEVFLDTNHDHLTYYHFIANALGTQYEEKNPERIGWNGAWEVKTTRNNKSWIAEIAIALKELELLPGHEKTWGINLCREQKYKKENSSLSCTFSSFHTPSRFADLKGIDIAASADGYKITELTYDYLTIEKKLCLHLKLKNDTEQVRKLKIHGKLISPSGKRDSIKRKLNLSGNKEIVLAFPIDEYGNYKLNVEVADKRARYSSPEILCQIPDLLTISTRDYYTTEKECKIKVVLGIKRKEELKGLTLNASLLEEDGRKVLKEKQLNLTSLKESEINLNIAELKPGKYPLKAELIKGGKLLASSDTIIHKIPIPKGNEVRIGLNGKLLVNGKPMFLFGIWNSSWNTMCEEALEGIAQNGFMAVRAPGNWWLEGKMPNLKKITSYLDTAQRYGLGVFVGTTAGPYYKSYRVLYKQPDLETFKQVISALKDHPALWGWYIMDEPAPDVWKERLSAVYGLIKKEDPHHIAWFCNYSPRNIAKFLDVSDVAAFNCYCIPNPGVFQVADWTDKAMRLANGERPVWLIHQAQGGRISFSREPTPDEERCMVYLGIIHGVKGLWCYYYRPMYEPLWLELRVLVQEMKELSPILLSPDIKQEVSIKPEASPIHFVQKRYQGKTYLIAVNAEDTEVDVSFNLSGLTSRSKIRVLFEERMISAGEGRFTDSFKSFASHVYEISL